MKSNLLIKFIVIAIAAFVWMSHSDGRAADKNQGNTGAPGDASVTCGASNCHGSNSISVSLEITVMDTDGSQVTEYSADKTYDIQVKVNHTGGNTPAAYGFQLVALTDDDNESTESFSSPAANVQLATANSTGRLYAEHNNPSSSNTFNLKWTAPAAGQGSVTFYAAGNGVNGNGMSSGDGANNTSLTIGEEMTSSNINLITEKWNLNLYPNPVHSDMNLELDHEDGAYLMTIIDVAGRSVESRQINFVNGRASISVGSLPTGNYSVLLQKEAEVAAVNMVKL